VKALVTGVAIAALMAAAGCYRGPYQTGTYPAGKTSAEYSNKVVYLDNLTYKLYVVKAGSTVGPDARLNVYAELENRTGSNLAIQVQTQFRDIAGTLTEDKTNWQTLVLAPHASKSYETVSMNSQARDYIIRVKLEDRH
jgi:hypothetical protein